MTIVVGNAVDVSIDVSVAVVFIVTVDVSDVETVVLIVFGMDEFDVRALIVLVPLVFAVEFKIDDVV